MLSGGLSHEILDFLQIFMEQEADATGSVKDTYQSSDTLKSSELNWDSLTSEIIDSVGVSFPGGDMSLRLSRATKHIFSFTTQRAPSH